MLQCEDSLAAGEADRAVEGPAPALSNTELLMLMYPRCSREAEAAFLLGTYKELVVAKQKDLLVGTVRGVLRAKVEHMANRAVPEIHFPPGWL